MNDLFKLNVQFDEKGEELEKIISYLLISQLEEILNIKKDLINKKLRFELK